MLEITDLYKIFNANTLDEKIALDHINLQVADGDFITIIGGNGAGKSTLFNAISGSFYPDGGKIVLDGKDITYTKNYKRAKEIGFLFQDPLKGTAPNMTIEENLALSYMRASDDKSLFAVNAENRKFFLEELEKLDLGLEDRLTSKVGLLSGGQRQALSLLMATMSLPKLLLLDEHTAALDPETSIKITKLTERIVAENNITCLMITHNINSALKLGNRTIMLNKGKIILDVKDEERADLNTSKVLELFKERTNTVLDDDNILLS